MSQILNDLRYGIRLLFKYRALAMRRGALQLAVGSGIGFILAVFAVGPLRVVLYQTDVRDPLVLAVVPLMLAAAGQLAIYLPARQATKVDASIALIAE